VEDIRNRLPALVQALFQNVPCGIGSKRKDLRVSAKQMDDVLKKGARWAAAQGYAQGDDIAYIEAGGCIPGADPKAVSERAYDRGKNQLGTLGSGNHFLEVGTVDHIYDPPAARALGLAEGQLTVMIHTGSRGLGHQICDDYIQLLLRAAGKYKIDLPDKQLCCAPVRSSEARRYLSAMACAANFAFCNRQIIGYWVAETFQEVLRMGPESTGLSLVYDICHNMAKLEDHEVDGRKKSLCVHRKGATLALPPHAEGLPERYKTVGQPVLVPGDMGRSSYVLVGTEAGWKETYGSCCHGAGRVLSRKQAKKAAKGRAIVRELEDRGIYVRSAGKSTVAEEMPDAYKDVDTVVDVLHKAGIAKKVAKLKPLGVVKG
jgi:tRNA-splicing ligase RtcB